MSAADAAFLLEAEVRKLGSPREGTPQWWTLQAKSLGLSFLRTAKQGQLTPVGANELRRATRVLVVTQERDEEIATLTAAKEAAEARVKELEAPKAEEAHV